MEMHIFYMQVIALSSVQIEMLGSRSESQTNKK